ncbi:CRISPR-associated endonuclease Cas2 [Thauera sp. JM12B12]|uniref:CRISPR-associated endonuclease Cas2 n=1 Tax=Thauera sp. JM12B12 TaxID=3142262 RepID=UPI0031F47352
MVSYDVADARRRRRIEHALHALGDRVQYSVFECFLTLPEARFHLARLAEALDLRTDSLRAYPLCAWCAAAVEWRGPGRRSEDKRVVVV